jgi:ribosomal-protein-alanine N-acetyltransferase
MAAQPTPREFTLTFAPMKRRHLNQVLAIESTVYTSGWSRQIFLNELLYASERSYIVAKVGRTIVGYVGIMFAPDEGHVTTIAVHQDWQRNKVATRLMLRAADETIDHGFDALTLEARVSNVAAHQLYEQFGFTSVGVRPGYYADNREDAVIMWVHNIQSAEYRDRLNAIAASLSGPREVR